jgi:Restriction endonuclease
MRVGRRSFSIRFSGSPTSADCKSMYDFLTLSPLDFEELIRDLLQAELNVRLESFGPGPDQGIDFRHSTGGRGIIVQAKHYGRSGTKKLVGAARIENGNVIILRSDVRRYILATSVSLSPALKNRIVAVMPDTPLDAYDIFGLEDLNNLLIRHPEVERQHFKLWLSSVPILERILKSGVYNRTQTEMDVIRDMVPRFVQNRSLVEAEAILADSGSVIISGEPGVGKSTLARMLVWLHAGQDWRIFVVDDIAEAFDVASEGEKRLIFFDDFLGQVRLSVDFMRGMDQRLPPFLERVSRNKNLRFILTTRDYILSQAHLLAGRLASSKIGSKPYILNVGAYTRGIRARILYNHLYFSDLSEEDREALLSDDFYLRIIDHKNFNPRLVQTLTSSDYAMVADEPIRAAVERILKNPHELWERPYRTHISDEGRALMLALLFNRRSVPLPELEHSFARMVRTLELGIAKADLHARFRIALREIEGSFVAIADRSARFSNPGVRDFLQKIVVIDEMLPSVIGEIQTCAELRQCWTIWSSAEANPKRTSLPERLWTDALNRMILADRDQAWAMLEMAIEVYDFFQTDTALERVRAARDIFAAGDFSSSETGEARHALESATMNLLPLDEMDAVRQLVTKKAGELLATFGYALPLDEIEALDNALHTYGSDTNFAERASLAGLAGFAEQIDDHLEDIGSVEDLEGFVEELDRLMKRRNFEHTRLTQRIAAKRSSLYRDEDSHARERYESTPGAPTFPDMTTDQIRSMFKGI